jgi:hemolysin III
VAAAALEQSSIGEEIANAVSHGVGAVLAIAGLATLVALAVARGDAWHVASAAVFGATMVLLYLASTLYHAIPGERAPRAKRVLQVIDHSAIYLLIAGSYTPFSLGPLRGPWGWSLLAVVWTGALAGVVHKAVAFGRAPILSVALYAGLGWSALVALGPLVRALEPGGLALLLGGGVAYTVGIAFFAWRRRFAHFVWHLFVLAGSALHWLAVLLYVLPPPA